MRKNIKTYIYVVTAILPIVLSACSNKTDNNMPKSTKESTTTTFAEDTSSNIVNTTVEITTEEDTTELISETEQKVINSTENITEQQQTQANIQQTTTVIPVNSTPTTTPILIETTTPKPTKYGEGNLYKIKEVLGLNEQYTYNGIEFTISNLWFDNDSHSQCSFVIRIINKNILEDPNSYDETGLYGSKLYFKYDVYDSEGVCVKTNFCEEDIESILDEFELVFIDISDLPSTGYTIKLSNYE